MAKDLLSTVGDHQKRIAALDGDVDLSTSEGFVSAIQSLGAYLISGDENALATAQHRLETLDQT